MGFLYLQFLQGEIKKNTGFLFLQFLQGEIWKYRVPIPTIFIGWNLKNTGFLYLQFLQGEI